LDEGWKRKDYTTKSITKIMGGETLSILPNKKSAKSITYLKEGNGIVNSSINDDLDGDR
jgi:hypothetical protein